MKVKEFKLSVEPLGLPVDVSKRKESLRLIYQPSVHWLGAITVFCILGIIGSVFIEQGAAVVGSLATIAGISAGAIAKIVDSPPSRSSDTSQNQ